MMTTIQCQKCGDLIGGKASHVCTRVPCIVCGLHEMWCKCDDKQDRFSSRCTVTDDNGNELVLTPINTLCPIEYLEPAKKIAHDFLVETERSSATLADMFTTFARPIGTTNATHVWCPRLGYDKDVVLQIARMSSVKKSQKLKWMSDRVYTLDDKHTELLTKFVCLTEDADTILAALRLEVL